jgi:hypothetical protein
MITTTTLRATGEQLDDGASASLEKQLCTGGKVTDAEVVVRIQTPQAPELQQWTPGIPDRRIAVADGAWHWSGEWKSDGDRKVAKQAGCEATLRFSGVALAMLGTLDQSSGQADVYLDGEKQPLILDAYIVPNTHDNVLWQVYGLSPGEHTLRIVTQGKADPRSAGTAVSIREAVVYRAAE